MTNIKLSPYIYAWSRGNDEFKISTLKDIERVHPKLKNVTLAFLTSDRYEEIRSWRGACEESSIKVTLSIGGALGQFPTPGKHLNEEIVDVLNLLTELKIDSVDLDIEGGSIEDFNKRNLWVKFAYGLQLGYLKKFNRQLSLSLTLPIEFSGGFNSNTKDLILEMKNACVEVSYFNCMIMCFNTKLNGGISWGLKCCQILQNGFDFLHSVFTDKSNEDIWKIIGACPMIGKNDDKITTISLGDWKEILDFAKSKNLGCISFWAINRDQRKPKLKIGSCYEYSLNQKNDHEYVQLMLDTFK